MIEFIVLFTSFKYVFVEGGEQVLVGIETVRRIGFEETLKITIFGLAVGVILYFVFLNVSGFVPVNLLEIALGVGLLFFSYTMFKEVIEVEVKMSVTKYRVGYFYIAMLEAVENSVALAAFSLINIVGTLIGALMAIGLLVGVAKIGLLKKVPVRLTRLVAGILLASTGIPLILYGLGIETPEFVHWIVPPLSSLR